MNPPPKDKSQGQEQELSYYLREREFAPEHSATSPILLVWGRCCLFPGGGGQEIYKLQRHSLWACLWVGVGVEGCKEIAPYSPTRLVGRQNPRGP